MEQEDFVSEIVKMRDEASAKVKKFKNADTEDEISELRYYHGQQVALNQVLHWIKNLAPTKAWEGLTASIDVNKNELIHETINKYGAEGWEFCQWLPANDGKCIYIFKRPKSTTPPTT